MLAVLVPLLGYLIVDHYSKDVVPIPRFYVPERVDTVVKNGEPQYDTVFHTIRDFTLTNQSGQQVSLKDLKGKVLLVSGTVARTEKQFSGALAVTLKANDIGSGVQCLFSRDRAYDAEKLSGEVTIRGRCDGWNMGVVLRGCTVR